jgi:hypothetical protein
MDSLTLIAKMCDDEDPAHPRFLGPRSAVSELPAVASPNNFDLYSGGHRTDLSTI